MTPKTSTKSLSNFGTEIMTRAGWSELWNGNSHRPDRTRGTQGIPDKGYIRDGVLLLVEEKRPKEKLRPKQEEFMNTIIDANIDNVFFIVVRSEDEYIEISNIRKI